MKINVDARLADNLAKEATYGHPSFQEDWDRLRDWLDGKTYSDLDCTQLDLLTDMVLHRLTKLSGER